MPRYFVQKLIIEGAFLAEFFAAQLESCLQWLLTTHFHLLLLLAGSMSHGCN